MNFSGIKKTLSKSVQSINSNKLLNNDILYKVVVVLAILNVISYIVSKNINAGIVFVLVYVATNYLTKNMTIVLLSAVFVTNFLIVSKKIKENMVEGHNETEPEETNHGTGVDDITDELKDMLENQTPETPEKKETVEKYDNIAKKLNPTDIAPVEFNADSAELTKQLKILNERTQNSMGMINKMGGIANIGKMIDSLTGIVNKLN